MWLHLITSITGRVTLISSDVSQTTRCNIGEVCITLLRGTIITQNGEVTNQQDRNGSAEVILLFMVCRLRNPLARPWISLFNMRITLLIMRIALLITLITQINFTH